MKRALDILLSTLGLLVFAFPLAALCGLQLVFMGGPLFFRQVRAGYKGTPFKIIKLRSMRSGSGTDTERVTAWGRFLRASSLDELPELWNVLRGEMSLVGPRPLPTAYLQHYSKAQAKRHDLRPGITGWAQINGRNGLSWERQFELDLWYIEHQSILLDLKIIALTFTTVLRRKGINASETVTRHAFNGSPSNSKN
jgi:lipopolysaccharide/colanic/teichoic acid biosynthesis glycosyltransferase